MKQIMPGKCVGRVGGQFRECLHGLQPDATPCLERFKLNGDMDPLLEGSRWLAQLEAAIAPLHAAATAASSAEGGIEGVVVVYPPPPHMVEKWRAMPPPKQMRMDPQVTLIISSSIFICAPDCRPIEPSA